MSKIAVSQGYRKVLLCVSTLMFASVFTVPSHSQTLSATPRSSTESSCTGPRRSITGSVTDSTGALISFVSIKATCGSLIQETKSDENGMYRLSLPSGSYSLKVTVDGYAPKEESLQITGASQQTAQAIVLSIASASSSVTVTAEGGMATSFATTSTKTDTPVLEQPFAIEAVTHDQLLQQNPQSVADTLAYTAGAQTLSVNGPAVMAVDSFSLRGAAADEYLDGMRIPQSFNAVQSGPASLQLDPNDLERLDILLGPSSTLYGQSNLGGIVDAISKQPTEANYRSLQLQIGSYSRYQGDGDFSGPLNRSGSLLYRVDGVVRRSDTFVYGMQDNRFTLNPTLTWHPTLNTTFSFYAKYLRNTTDSVTAYVPASGTVTLAPYGYLPVSINLGDPTYDRYRKNQFFTGYSIDHRSTGRWTVRHQLRYVYTNANMHFLYLTGLLSDGVTGTRTNYDYVPTLQGIQTDSHAQTTLRTGPVRHTLIGGLDFQWQKYEYQQALAAGSTINVTDPVYGQGDKIPAVTINQRQTQFQGGLYGQEQMDVSHFTIIAGGRADFTAEDTFNNLTHAAVSSQSPHAFTGHAGVSYHLAGFAPYFSYSTSFLPTLGSNAQGSPYVPTTGSNLEGGLKYQFTRVPLMLRVAGFSLTQKNTLQPDPSNPTNSIQNGEIHTPGAEVQANGTILHSLDYTVSYTHIRPVNTVSTNYYNKQPVTVADNTASTWLHYTVRHGLPAGLGVGAGTRYVGSSWGTVTNNLRVPGATLFDVALDYTLDRWRLAINSRNIGDRRYVNGCSNAYFCAYGAPRTVVGSATFNF
jgi:iron complex outermembrane recepter protein